MKIGDLVKFRPNWGSAMWVQPAIVIERFPPPDEELWVVYAHGRKCVVELRNYIIKPLTSC
jgi:hypothetical protein